MKTKLFFTAIAVFTFMGVASAQQNTANDTTKKTARAFTDTNSDGICDNYVQQNNRTPNKKNYQNQSVQKRTGNKKGNAQGNGHGKRFNFVDKDQNGICDNRE